MIATEDLAVAQALRRVFQSGLFRVYTNHDVVGSEMGGALKNVVAISAGMAQGVGVGDNTRSAVITRGLAELSRLGVAMGGEVATFAWLTGLGDLLATCISPHSRNRYVGEQLGVGRTLAEVLDEMNMVAEGVKTAASVGGAHGDHSDTIATPPARRRHHSGMVVMVRRSARKRCSNGFSDRICQACWRCSVLQLLDDHGQGEFDFVGRAGQADDGRPSQPQSCAKALDIHAATIARRPARARRGTRKRATLRRGPAPTRGVSDIATPADLVNTC